MKTFDIKNLSYKYFPDDDVWEIYVPRKEWEPLVNAGVADAGISIKGETKTLTFVVHGIKGTFYVNGPNRKLWKCNGFCNKWDDPSYTDNFAIVLI